MNTHVPLSPDESSPSSPITVKSVAIFISSLALAISLPITMWVSGLNTHNPSKANALPLGSVHINPEIITTDLRGSAIELSALAYDTGGNPIWSGVSYQWGMSSIHSVGTLSPNANDKLANFLPSSTNRGAGDIWVRAYGPNETTATGSIPVYVGITPTPSPTPILGTTPISIIETFTGNGSIESDKWNWSGSLGSNVTKESDALKVSVSAGQDAVGGNDAVVQALTNFQIPTITGDFDVTVDLAGINSNYGWQELRFVSTGSISIRRSRAGLGETLEVWTSPNNVPSDSTRNVYRSMPVQNNPLKVKLARVGNEILAYYHDGATYINILGMSYAPISGEGKLPMLVVENSSPSYPATTGYFDNYQARASAINFSGVSPTPTRVPTNTPTPSPSPFPIVTPTPSPSPFPTVTPTPTVPSIPTVTPTPSTGPKPKNTPPTFETRSLPFAFINKPYLASITATDPDRDTMTMTMSGLPKNLRQGICTSSIQRLRPFGSSLTCAITGSSARMGLSIVTITVKDSKNNTVSRSFPLMTFWAWR